VENERGEKIEGVWIEERRREERFIRVFFVFLRG
jgi:hypothetical protein